MGIVQFDTNTARIAKSKGAILAHAIPRMVLSITGRQHEMKRNMSDTVVFRRWLPYGGATTNSTTINAWSVDPATHQTTDGVTPTADTITPQDITVTLQEYAFLYSYTNRTAELYEDDVPAEMETQAGERAGLLKEMIDYGALKGCTNKFYAGGTSRATVDETVDLNILRRVSRTLEGNRCNHVTKTVKASPDYGTAPVEGGFIVFCDYDMAHDIRELPGFTKVVEYGDSKKALHPREIGAVDEFRFITSPELGPVADAGAAIGSTGLISTTGSNIDVYFLIVIGEESWGDVCLRGLDSFSLKHLPIGMDSKSDPINQRGYVGGRMYAAPFIQNDGWMAVIEAGASSLT